MNRAQGGMTGGVITGRPTAAIHAVARLMSPPRHRRARRALGQRREPVPVIA
jgi:CBS domain-containing protein